MSYKISETLWPAEPHTIAKITILEKYLALYFLILGSKSTDEILCVDGFAGPGKYTNYNTGSPIAALRAATVALALNAPPVIARKIHFVFIEERKDRFEFLKNLVEPFRNPRITVTVLHRTFVDSLPEIEKLFPNAFTSMRSFFFIDPFGATGVPFKVCERILANQRSELFLNLDGDGIARIFLAGESARSSENLETIFGDSEDWPSLFGSSPTLEDCARESLEIYKKNLFKLRGVDYAFPYEMRGKNDRLNYFLLFASHHPLGLVKMKEAMEAINKDGSYVFSDARVGQHKLFSEDDPEYYAGAMLARFTDRQVSLSDVEKFILNETPYKSVTQVLKFLQNQGHITLKMFEGHPMARKGTFPANKVQFIIFS